MIFLCTFGGMFLGQYVYLIAAMIWRQRKKPFDDLLPWPSLLMAGNVGMALGLVLGTWLNSPSPS